MANARNRRKGKQKSDGLPLVAVLGIGMGFIIAYLGAETLMDPSAHPLHWLGAAAGGVVGYLIGALWYRLRGDIV